MPTLVLTPRFTDDSQLLWQAAIDAGWRVERLSTWRVPESLKDVPDPVVYVEALFGPTIAADLGVTLTEPPLDWLPALPLEYRRRAVDLTTLGAARGTSQPAFVKPPNDKSFPARVYRGAELPADFPDDMPVLVSEIVTWETEFRCFVLDRTLRTFSIYARFGQLQEAQGWVHSPEEEDGLHGFLQTLLADPRVELPRATVLDVGVIAGRGWGVVEQNSAWGAGIYGADPAAVLDVIRHASWRSR